MGPLAAGTRGGNYESSTSNVRLLNTMTKRTGACLRNWQKQGAVSRKPGPGQFSLWEIDRPRDEPALCVGRWGWPR